MQSFTRKDIKKIIDEHILKKHSFMFVCDANLAYFISDYLDEEYEIYDRHSCLYTNTKEFYVMVYFNYPEIDMYCESAKGQDGNYKLSDIDNFNYFIGVDMSENEIKNKLKGDGCTWVKFRLE